MGGESKGRESNKEKKEMLAGGNGERFALRDVKSWRGKTRGEEEGTKTQPAKGPKEPPLGENKP